MQMPNIRLYNLFDNHMGTILCNLVTLKLVYNGLKTQMLILFMSFIIFYFPRPSGGPSINIRCPKTIWRSTQWAKNGKNVQKKMWLHHVA